jgi:signal transduction histidine kinase
MARFRTRARAVDLLGKQQIRDEITAISELLRNSYDAEAKEGLIDVDTKNKQILVWDDGDGMDESDIIADWLTIGTYSKKKEEVKRSSSGRVKIGEKGIGRLAISLLGDQMLLISKKKISGKWSLLYLHWDLFRNMNLFLEEINLPTRSFNTLDELFYFLRNELFTLKQELLLNIEDESRWEKSQLDKVKQEIENFEISNEAFRRLKINDKKGGGTLFYIKNMEDDWDWEVYLTKVEDESRKERKNNLTNVLVSFSNLIDLFDKKMDVSDQEKTKKFVPKIHINGIELENESWFNPDDIELFDYALKGRIVDGAFSGNALIKNEGGVESYSIEGQTLTSGIHTSSMVDIGPIEVKWFFVEGRKQLTAIPPDQHDMILEKLRSSGGIYVFRDGLRILPYGEKGNDFLEIEERRSRGAGYYLFSHRRMYGFVEISKINNPKLVDKSSREGFIGNRAFEYFCALAKNLLKWWAIDFLESSNKDNGRRNMRNQRIMIEREKQTKALEKQREEEIREKQYQKDLQKELKEFPNKLEALRLNIISNIDELINKANLTNSYSGDKFHDWLYSFRQELFNLIGGLDSVRIKYNLRFAHEPEIMDEIDASSYKIEKVKIELSNYIYKETEKIKENIDKDESNKSDYFEEINEFIEYALTWKDVSLPQLINTKINREIEILNSTLVTFKNELLKESAKKINEVYSHELSSLTKALDIKAKEMEVLSRDLNSFEYIWNEENLKQQINELIMSYNLIKNEIQQKLLQTQSNYHIENLIESINDFHTNAINGLKFVTDNAYIGLLKKEVSLYRDLSAVGLAAELTSHEFNALYSGIREDLSVLNKALAKSSIVPIVSRVFNSFKSLERLHQRMNPLYRQVRARKENISLRKFLESVLEYFESDIARYKIDIEIIIDEDFSIKENDSVLFTPIINLLSNSIYWLLDSKEKRIVMYVSNNGEKLYICDSGPGIPPQDQERIFEPFFSKKTEGRGLGLFLSKDILEARGHKLYLNVGGNSPLSGACFCIEFNENAIGDNNNEN